MEEGGTADGVPDRAAAQATLRETIEFYHSHVDDPIPEHTGACDHPECSGSEECTRPTTAREYFREDRGWTDATIDDLRLGWAPPDHKDQLIRHLYDRGFDRAEMLATGLFGTDGDNLYTMWAGRYVLTYFDADGDLDYALARATGAKGGGGVGYDGHAADGMEGKYAKLAHTREDVPFAEPIWGRHTLTDGEPLLIAEGIADGITAAEEGYNVVSPVAKEFKREDSTLLLDLIEDYHIPCVYVVPDNERATSDRITTGDGEAISGGDRIRDSLAIPNVAPGTGGGLRTAHLLRKNGVDARVAVLPLPARTDGFGKVDLDDYLHGNFGSLDAVLQSAKPPAAHPQFEAATGSMVADTAGDDHGTGASGSIDHRAGGTAGTTAQPAARTGQSALWEVDLTDLVPYAAGERGVNPLGHTGESENYFVVREGSDGSTLATDYKRSSGRGGGAVYNALTHLLVAAGERPISDPEGDLSNREIWSAWRHAKDIGVIPSDDPIPRRALTYLATEHGQCTAEEIEDGWLPQEAYNAALDVAQTEYDMDPGRSPLSTDGDVADEGMDGTGGAPATLIETSPPTTETEPFDRESIWADLQGPILSRCLDADGPALITGEAGTGKTTNVTTGLVDRDESIAVLFANHEKAREFAMEAETPTVDLHLKGAEQPRYDCCMEAKGDSDENEEPHCPEHGRPTEWPRMHPVYELPTDHPVRATFDSLTEWRQVRQATFDLKDDLADATGGDPTESAWFRQFDHLESASVVVGVAPYATLKSLREEYTVVFDDTNRIIKDSTHKLSSDTLYRTARHLQAFAENDPVSDDGNIHRHNAEAFAEFAGELADVLTAPDGSDPTLDYDDLGDLSAPDIECVTHREYEGVNSQHYRTRDLPDETLAQLKVTYGEYALRQIREDDRTLNGAIPCLDPLIAAAVVAGFDADAGTRALAVPWTLDGTCPHCRGSLAAIEGRRVCEECNWDENEDYLTRRDGERARARARFDRGKNGHPTALTYKRLPSQSGLPDDPLILAANADPTPYAGLFGCPQDGVYIEDPAPGGFDMPGLRLCQITTGQYHKSTIERSERAQAAFQRIINMSDEYDCPLFVLRKDLIPHFSFPEAGEVVHYHALRGLNYTECDAVYCIGAPHPDPTALEHDAELLAMHREDIPTGGAEYSTRRESTNPPAYRKLNYVADDGRGRAVATKAYTGLMGTLFREGRAGELEQAVHRTRPLLADGDDPVDAYLLTNVPTELPVDTLANLDELTADLRDFLPAPDGALDLASELASVAAGDAPEGYQLDGQIEYPDGGDGDGHGRVRFTKAEATELAEAAGITTREGKAPGRRTVGRWVSDLTDLGLLAEGEYKQPGGRQYRTTAATSTLPSLDSSSDGNVEVHGLRRLRAEAEAANGAAEWIRLAERVFGQDGAASDRG